MAHVSWYQLLDIIKQAAAEREYWATTPPLACPLCGEPLIQAPPTAESTLFCKWDGWSYPRDWTRPQLL